MVEQFRYLLVMPEVITQREFRDENAAVIDRVARGESFLVTRHGKPVAEVRPLASGLRRIVSKDALRSAFEGVGPRIGSVAFRRDLDQALGQTG